MSRPRKQAYRSGELSELARQLMYAPPEKRAVVVRLAERFHDELEPTKNYPIDFVVYRLTERRVPPRESVLLVGEAVKPDLRLMIDALSRSIQMPPEADDPSESTAELAKRLGVSTKTVARWRDAGLRWRWGVREARGKPGVLIARSALAAFNKSEQGRVDAASRFSQMDDAEKQRLVERARRLAQATDQPPQAIYRHLARRSGRSVEAIRLLITQHDRDHSDEPILIDHTAPLTEKHKGLIDRAYMGGGTVSQMCQRFGKTRSTIYRAIHEGRARRALSIGIGVVGSPMFKREDADEVLLRPLERPAKRRRLDAKVIEAVPEPLQPIYAGPIDPDAVLRTLIVRYNFLKYQAACVQETLRSGPPRAADLNRFDSLLQRSGEARCEFIAGALPLVLSMVSRHLAGGETASSSELMSLLDIGNAVLIEEIERFDAALSHTFESVLTNRLLRELARKDLAIVEIDADAILLRLERVGF